MVSSMRAYVTLIAIAAATGCATYDDNFDWQTQAATAIQTEPESCSRQLNENNDSPHDELDSADIRVVNWNIQKGGDPEWMADLTTFKSEP
jgi:hypothetical protein